MPEVTIEMSISEDMVERVIREWQEENPLRTPDSMTAAEFSSRMMAEMKASTRIVK